MADASSTPGPQARGAAVGAAISRIGDIAYGTSSPAVGSMLGAPSGFQSLVGQLLQGFPAAGDGAPGTRTGTFWGRRYSVTVGIDGAITVRPDDWLSKYSVAMFDNLMHVPEYGRKDPNGAVRPVQNPDLIYAGETLYHIPTYEQHTAPAAPKTVLPQLGEQAVKAELKRFLQREYELPGEHLDFIEKIGDILEWVDLGTGVFEPTGLLELLGKGGGAGQTAGNVVGVLGVASQLITVLDCWRGIINAQEVLQRIWGMMAVAYTTTAWGFDDEIPTHSPQLLAILRDPGTLGIPDRAAMETECMNAWAVSATSTVDALDKSVRERYRQDKYLKAIIRALGKDVRAATCDLLKRALEDKFESQDRHAWKATYATAYPG